MAKNFIMSKLSYLQRDFKSQFSINGFEQGVVSGLEDTQMIGQPTHIMNHKSPCIDLLFTTNSKLLCDVGVEQTIYNKCHYNIIYGSLNLNISLPPSY